MLVERLGGEVAIEPQIITGEGVKVPMLVGFIRTATPRLLIRSSFARNSQIEPKFKVARDPSAKLDLRGLATNAAYDARISVLTAPVQL
jgi:hypothetical protein